MMKKNGFTLAEVLITLAIIGVVATLTLPALMSNTAEQQYMTGFKKIMNSLNEAGQMNAALEGYDYSVASTGNNASTVANQDLWGLFKERLQVSKEASDSKGYGGPNSSGTSGSNQCSGNTVVLRDGTAICLELASRDTSGTTPANYWLIYVDANGPKGPNQLSYCDKEGCTDKTKRVIRDQFAVTLSRGTAVPGHWTAYETEGKTAKDYAARYAMGIGQNYNKTT